MSSTPRTPPAEGTARERPDTSAPAAGRHAPALPGVVATARRPDALGVVVTLCGWLAVAAVTRPWLLSEDGEDVFHLDAWIYRTAVAQWHAGGSLYDWWADPSRRLWPFTYPPFAAWALTPLTWVGEYAAQAALVVATPLAVALTVWACLRALAGDGRRGSPARGRTHARAVVAAAVPWVTAACVVLVEPVHKTMQYGQVNALLMALVAVDLLVVPERSRCRGALSGLAAALKLTPAVAVLVLLARGERRAAATMAASAVLVTASAWAVSPSESWRFFTQAMLDPSRAGDADYAGNQNLRALLARAWPQAAPEQAQDVVWAVAVVAAVVGTWLLVRALGRAPAGSDGAVLLLQISAVMVLGLLVSPISWSHHWVWVVCALLGLLAAGREWGEPSLTWVAGAGTVVVLAAPHWWFTEGAHREQDWPWWQQLLGSSYTWWALTAGVVLALAVRRRGAGR